MSLDMSTHSCSDSTSFCLPGQAKTGIPVAKDARQEFSASRARPLVVVADDERIITETLVAILDEEGFDAIAAYDGVSALEETKKLSPDVVLLDVDMPRLNGVEAAKTIFLSMPKVRIVLLSGHAETANLLARAREAGFEFEVFAKPIKPDILVKALRSPRKN